MKKITLSVLSLLLLSACSSFIPKMPDISLPTLFKVDVNQGSVLDRYSVNQLKVGMSKTEVKALIGSPSIADPFHNSQWDYVNHSTLYEKDNISYRLTLIFDKNILQNIDTSKLGSLPPLTEKEQELENKRLAKEKIAADQIAKEKAIADKKAAEMAEAKAKVIADKKAVEVAKAKAKAKVIADKKAAEVAKAKAKAKVIADKKAAEVAEAKAKAKVIADKKAAEVAKALEEKRAAEAKAKNRKENLKEGYDAYKEAENRAKSLKGPNTPWYQFW